MTKLSCILKSAIGLFFIMTPQETAILCERVILQVTVIANGVPVFDDVCQS